MKDTARHLRTVSPSEATDAGEVTIDPAEYLESIRHSYQKSTLYYQGRRDEEQGTIASLLSNEARDFVDGALLATVHASTYFGKGEFITESQIDNYLQTIVGEEGLEKYHDMRNAFEQLVAAIGVASHRCEKEEQISPEGVHIRSLIGLDDQTRYRIIEQLFADFQELNTLRFGAHGSGNMREVKIDPMDDDSETVKYDKDVIPSNRLWNHILGHSYRESLSEDALPAVHVAGKFSPEEYRELRKQYPEIPKQQFDRVMGFVHNARDALEDEYSK